MAMKKKGYAKGGAMKKKGYAKGGVMKKKPVAMSKGSKLKMVEKGGKKVPFFAADGVGKMKDGGATKPKKRPAGKVFVPATKAQLEKIRADKRRAERKKSGQLDQAKKKAKKTAVKAMGGGMMMKKKGYAKGGVVKKMRGGMMMKKKGYAKGGSVARGSGAARPQRFRRNG